MWRLRIVTCVALVAAAVAAVAFLVAAAVHFRTAVDVGLVDPRAVAA
jgi:hypothetical protein